MSAKELLLEAQGSKPNFRYDLIQPLLQGRVRIAGSHLRTSGINDNAFIPSRNYMRAFTTCY